MEHRNGLHPARRLTRVALAALALLAAAPAAASADTVARSQGRVTYDASLGQTDTVAVTASGGDIVVRDSTTPAITPGSQCAAFSPDGASCSASNVADLMLFVRDGDDAATIGVDLPATVYGGAGADALTGGPRGDALFGEGDDDVLAGGGGADWLSGSSGFDTVTYAGATAPVAVTPDLLSNDGVSGEYDNVTSSVERVVGGGAGDQLTGGSADNVLEGGPGDDVLAGGDGADRLLGGEGDDRFAARDGAADTIVCGAGADRVDADPVDSLSADCETAGSVEAPVAPPAGDPKTTPQPGGDETPGDPDPAAVPLLVPLKLPAAAVVSGRGTVTLSVFCPATELRGCRGSLFFDPLPSPRRRGKANASRRGRGRYGRGRYVVARGKSGKVKVRLSATARRALGLGRPRGRRASTARRGRGKLRVQVTTISRGRRPARSSITLRR
jgi:hypothetical protein